MKGSGVDEWPCMKLVGVQVHTGTRIHWDAHQTYFLYESQVRSFNSSTAPSTYFRYARLVFDRLIGVDLF